MDATHNRAERAYLARKRGELVAVVDDFFLQT